MKSRKSYKATPLIPGYVENVGAARFRCVAKMAAVGSKESVRPSTLLSVTIRVLSVHFFFAPPI